MTPIVKIQAPGKIPALSIRHLTKRFGGALALNDVSLDIAPGEVHGLLGHNGSGKSTLIKILAGFHTPEAGAEISVNGNPIPLPMSPTDPSRLGIAFVHQHLGLIPSLSVLENLRLSAFSTQSHWSINWRLERRRANELFKRFGLSIDPGARLSELTQVERAMVAIVRAFDGLQSNAASTRGILVLDEPTPFLPRTGVNQLFDLVRAIVAQGSSVIFVSHDVDEIIEITDRATILRDGVVAGTVDSKAASNDDFVELIMGRRVKVFQTKHRDFSDQPARFKIERLSGSIVEDAALDIRRGEIVGLTGLIGSGFDEIPYLLSGADPASGGMVSIDGVTHQVRQLTPHFAMKIGLSLLPSERLARAGIGALSVAENMTLPVLERFRTRGFLNWKAIERWANDQNIAYEVRPNRPKLRLQSLSGGNQQKVLLAKWLQLKPILLMLDEPTQGVDVGARQKIYEALNDAASAGTSILCASTDAEQLAQICDRVLVFARGRIVCELTGDEISKDSITEQCLRSASMKTSTGGNQNDRNSRTN
ncbi:sugar ABC transporter ATP-binding protein [Pseudaminobacter sp. NGMCC 1.201702]|uniref:sugar ABC transporter ATP-binding protein n=1 Tax=Pseudaminobacter sp. NGMCC 1.201702 TaxID=3391825 RepID=UPI0039EE9746